MCDKPAGVVRFDGPLTKDEYRALCERWEAAHASVRHVPVPHSLKVVQLTWWARLRFRLADWIRP